MRLPISEELFKIKVSFKGQVVIPKPLREAYNINEADEILMVPLEEGILIKPVRKTLKLRGFLKKFNVDMAECEAILAKAKKSLRKGF